MPTLQELNEFLNGFAPPVLAEEWDHVGLQVGSLRSKVEGVLVALDVTDRVLEEASRLKANVLITHHPLFFKAIKKLDDSQASQASQASLRLIQTAVENKIHILVFHTNLDSTHQGLNDLLATRLRLKKIRPFLSSGNSRYPRAGLGRIGIYPKTSLQKFIHHVGGSLQISNLRFVGDPDMRVNRVAVITGAGAGYFLEAKQAGADVLVTGDVKYHPALDALAEGIALIDVGHFASEIGMVGLIATKLTQRAKQKSWRIPIFESRVQSDPFGFWSP